MLKFDLSHLNKINFVDVHKTQPRFLTWYHSLSIGLSTIFIHAPISIVLGVRECTGKTQVPRRIDMTANNSF